MSTKEEIISLVERVQGGEDALMPELWNEVERLVAWYVGKTIPNVPISAGVTFEDLYNSGYLALAYAVRHYDQNGSFIALFMLCLKTAFVEASGTRSKGLDPLRRLETQSLDAPLPGFEDITLGDTISDFANAYESVEKRIFNEQLHNELERALSALPAIKAEALRYRYFKGSTLKETGEALSVTVKHARLIEGQALRDIRKSHAIAPLRQFLESGTPYYLHVGVQQFNRTNTSATEQIVLIREHLEESNKTGSCKPSPIERKKAQ